MCDVAVVVGVCVCVDMLHLSDSHPPQQQYQQQEQQQQRSSIKQHSPSDQKHILFFFLAPNTPLQLCDLSSFEQKVNQPKKKGGIIYNKTLLRILLC